MLALKLVVTLRLASLQDGRAELELSERLSQVKCIVLASQVEKMFTAGLDLTESLHRDASDVGRTALVLREVRPVRVRFGSRVSRLSRLDCG